MEERRRSKSQPNLTEHQGEEELKSQEWVYFFKMLKVKSVFSGVFSQVVKFFFINLLIVVVLS